MSYSFLRTLFPLLILLLILTFTPTSLVAQFEQKLSINLSGGFFNTVGTKGWEAEWSSGKDDREPTLMPNFKPGFSLGGSFQLNMNRHLSLEATIGIMVSTGWYYDYSGGGESFNYLYYEEYTDTIDYLVLFSGENEMTLTNLVVGLAPKYYFHPGNKLNPYAFAGITYNITHVNFIDNAYNDFVENGRLEELEVGDENYWFSDHSGLGMFLGGGVEYGFNETIGLFVQAGYYFIPLKEAAFIYDKFADFHSVNIHLGVRFSFLKSKDL